ncbi:hypothetical protein BC830DRAFT_1234546, partial [Chytriomyces sp. MP71]
MVSRLAVSLEHADQITLVRDLQAPPKKEKAQKMSLAEFNSAVGGDWADDVGDLPSGPGGFDAPLPTGPARSGAQDRSGPGYGGSDRGAPRGDVVFPTEGP